MKRMYWAGIVCSSIVIGQVGRWLFPVNGLVVVLAAAFASWLFWTVLRDRAMHR